MSANPPPDSSATDQIAQIEAIIERKLRDMGVSRLWWARIATGYASGNPAVKLPSETDSTAGTKTFQVVEPYTAFGPLITAADTVAFLEDANENGGVLGKLVNVSALNIQANGIAGITPVELGTTTTHGTANTERNTNSATYVKVKEFWVGRPGRYRVQFRLSRDAGTAQAIIRIARQDGGGVAYVDASVAVSESSATYPTFSATKTADMNVTLDWAGSVSVWLLNTLGPTDTAYIDSAVIKSQPATAAVTIYDAMSID